MADSRNKGQDEQDHLPDKRTQLGQHQDKQAQQKNPAKQNQRAAPLGLDAKDDSGTVVKRNKNPGGKAK